MNQYHQLEKVDAVRLKSSDKKLDAVSPIFHAVSGKLNEKGQDK